MEKDLSTTVDRFNEIMANFDQLAHVVIKGHLLIEEAISNILDLHAFHPEHIQKQSYTFF